jgi:type I restriction enzyme, S subunit
VRYPEYRNVNCAWLTEIPRHWEVKPLKLLVSKLVAGGTPDTSVESNWTDEPDGIAWVAISDMTRDRTVRSTERRITAKALREKRLQVLPEGTLLYSMYASLGKVARLAHPAVTNQAILGIVPRLTDVDERFLERWLEQFEQHVGYLSNGNTQDNLNAAKVRSIPVCVPPVQEQRAIANFLDRKTAAIDALTAKKERLIELLQQKRQALLTQAVTKGLAPTVPMKDSAMPWLGEIPSHWALRRLKQLSHRISGRLVYQPAQYFSDEGVPFIMGNNVTEQGITLEQTKFIPNDVNTRFAHHALRTGDVVMVRVGAPGVTAVVGRDADGLNCGSLMIVRRNDAFHSAWLAAVMNSPVVRAQIDLVQYGAAQEQINITDAVNFWIPTPSLEEQERIAEFVTKATGQLDQTTDKVREQIARLGEYRQALITATVTGKLDVSKEAA